MKCHNKFLLPNQGRIGTQFVHAQTSSFSPLLLGNFPSFLHIHHPYPLLKRRTVVEVFPPPSYPSLAVASLAVASAVVAAFVVAPASVVAVSFLLVVAFVAAIASVVVAFFLLML